MNVCWVSGWISRYHWSLNHMHYLKIFRKMYLSKLCHNSTHIHPRSITWHGSKPKRKVTSGIGTLWSCRIHNRLNKISTKRAWIWIKNYAIHTLIEGTTLSRKNATFAALLARNVNKNPILFWIYIENSLAELENKNCLSLQERYLKRAKNRSR